MYAQSKKIRLFAKHVVSGGGGWWWWGEKKRRKHVRSPPPHKSPFFEYCTNAKKNQITFVRLPNTNKKKKKNMYDTLHVVVVVPEDTIFFADTIEYYKTAHQCSHFHVYVNESRLTTHDINGIANVMHTYGSCTITSIACSDDGKDTIRAEIVRTVLAGSNGNENVNGNKHDPVVVFPGELIVAKEEKQRDGAYEEHVYTTTSYTPSKAKRMTRPRTNPTYNKQVVKDNCVVYILVHTTLQDNIDNVDQEEEVFFPMRLLTDYALEITQSVSSYMGMRQRFAYEQEGHTGLNNGVKLVDMVNMLRTMVLNRKEACDPVRILEIGFNVGNSTEAFLSADERVHVDSLDLGSYINSKIAAEYMATKFPTRHRIFWGSSLDTLHPSTSSFVAENKAAYDMIFIDGGHMYPVPDMDIFNCRLLSKSKGIVIVDDIIMTKELEAAYTIDVTTAWLKALRTGLVREISMHEYGFGWGMACGEYIR
jgi:predicted O-methyltransferase YrrM